MSVDTRSRFQPELQRKAFQVKSKVVIHHYAMQDPLFGDRIMPVTCSSFA